MNEARIVLQPPLDALVESGGPELLVHADTVASALGAACERHPRLRSQLFVNDRINPYIYVFHNSEMVDHEACAHRPVAAADEICVLTAIRGG